MNHGELLKRIISDPKVLGGKPVVKGTRLSVEFIVELLACGATAEQILGEYTSLSLDDIRACLLFASRPGGGGDDGAQAVACWLRRKVARGLLSCGS